MCPVNLSRVTGVRPGPARPDALSPSRTGSGLAGPVPAAGSGGGGRGQRALPRQVPGDGPAGRPARRRRSRGHRPGGVRPADQEARHAAGPGRGGGLRAGHRLQPDPQPAPAPARGPAADARRAGRGLLGAGGHPPGGPPGGADGAGQAVAAPPRGHRPAVLAGPVGTRDRRGHGDLTGNREIECEPRPGRARHRAGGKA